MKVKKEHIRKAHEIIEAVGGWRERHVISEPCNYYYFTAVNYTIVEIVKQSADSSVYGVNDCCLVDVTRGLIVG